MLHVHNTVTSHLLAISVILPLASVGVVLLTFLWSKYRRRGDGEEPMGPVPTPDSPPAPIRPLSGHAQSRLHEVLVLVPRYYDDGTQVPEHVHEEILDAIDHRFGGWTNHGICHGCSDGHREEMMCLEVALRDEQLHEIRQFIIEVGLRLGQNYMYQRVTSSVVEIVDLKAESRKKAA